MGRRLAVYAQPGGRGVAPDVAAYIAGVKEGDRLKNPAYAATVRRIANEGPKAFYEGEIPAAIAAKVAAEPNPGKLTAADISAYKPKKGPALCKPYRSYVVCAPNAPSGGPGVLMGLGIFEHTAIAAHGPTNEAGVPLYAGLDADGRPDDVAYAHLTAPIIKAIHELSASCSALAARVSALEQRAKGDEHTWL